VFAIILSALYSIVGWVFRSLVIRFGLFFGLYFVTTEFVEVIQSWLPSGDALSSAFGSIPNDAWYFLDLCGLSDGAPAILTAYLTRFTIRRVPIIG
jgi:hypothetical protein